MNTENQAAIEIAKILLKSTANYYYDNIHNDKDKNAYIKGAKEIYSILDYHSNIDYALQDILKLKSNLPTKFLDKFELFSDTKRHYMLSFEHATDILKSVNNRFVVGTSDSDDIFIRNILEDRHENKGFFRKI